MATTKKWTVDIFLDEHEEGRNTRAEARLHSGDATDVRGIGRSWRNPHDPEVPEIGDELAAARALADLAEHLRGAAALDIAAINEQASHGW
jgi:Rv2632c-like